MTRDEAIEGLHRILGNYYRVCNEHLLKEIDVAEEINSLNMAIEALERKRGIWMPIERGDKGYSAGDFICSCCGKPNKCYSVTDYCCNCGAKMERKR